MGLRQLGIGVAVVLVAAACRQPTLTRLDEDRGCLEAYRGSPPGEPSVLYCDWHADGAIHAVDADGTCWTIDEWCNGWEEWGWRDRQREDTHCIGMDSGAFPDCDELEE